MLLSAVFLVFSTVTQHAEAAYSDYSVYELETKQQFASENEALQAAAKLKRIRGGRLTQRKPEMRRSLIKSQLQAYTMKRMRKPC